MKKLFALLLVLMLLCSCAVSEAPEVSETSEEDEFTEEYYDRKFMDEVVTDEEKRENIFSALDDIQINTEFIKDFKKITRRECVISNCASTSDAIYFSEKNIPTILMNPKGANWHGKDEYVEIESLYTLYKIFKTLL